MTDVIGHGRLLLVTFERAPGSSADDIERALLTHVAAAALRRLHDTAFVVYADVGPADVRDWLASVLGPGAGAFVVEFERWSAQGSAIDARWLLRRGH